MVTDAVWAGCDSSLCLPFLEPGTEGNKGVRAAIFHPECWRRQMCCLSHCWANGGSRVSMRGMPKSAAGEEQSLQRNTQQSECRNYYIVLNNSSKGRTETYKILQIVISRRLREGPLKFCYASCSSIYLSCVPCHSGLFQHLLSDMKMSFPFFGTKLILVRR